MRVGDLVQVKNHSWGEEPSIGLVTRHKLSVRGYNVWGVALNSQKHLHYYMTHELLVINESR